MLVRLGNFINKRSKTDFQMDNHHSDNEVNEYTNDHDL